MQFIVLLLDHNVPYGPFDDADEAQRFAAALTAEVDPAVVKPLHSPVSELLAWRAHAQGKPAAQPANRLDQLRKAVLAQGGDWTTQRAVDALDGWPTPERARQLLNQLAAEGLLVKHGTRGKSWTPTGDGQGGVDD